MLNHLRRWTQTVSLFIALSFFYGCGVGRSSPATAAECSTYPRFASTANLGDNAASAFSVKAEVGQLRHHDYVAAGTSPLSITVDPTGKFAYVANTGSNTVSVYIINATTGAFTEVTGSPFAAGMAPIAVTVDPAGKSAYVENTGSNTVSVYTIDARTGALSNRQDIAGRSGKLVIAIVKDAALVRYTVRLCVEESPRTVCAHAINVTIGVLTMILGFPVHRGEGVPFLTRDAFVAPNCIVKGSWARPQCEVRARGPRQSRSDCFGTRAPRNDAVSGRARKVNDNPMCHGSRRLHRLDARVASGVGAAEFPEVHGLLHVEPAFRGGVQ